MESALLAFALGLCPQDAPAPPVLAPGLIESTLPPDAEMVTSPGLARLPGSAVPLGRTFACQLPAGGRFTFRLHSHLFDAYLLVADASGKLLAENDDGPLGTHAELCLEVPAGAQLSVTACARDGRSGPFRLELLAGEPPPVAERALVRDAGAALQARRQLLGADHPYTELARLALAHHRGGTPPGAVNLMTALLYARALIDNGDAGRAAVILDASRTPLLQMDAERQIAAVTMLNVGSLMAETLAGIGRREEALDLVHRLRPVFDGQSVRGQGELAALLQKLATAVLACGDQAMAESMNRDAYAALKRCYASQPEKLLGFRFKWALSWCDIVGDRVPMLAVAREAFAAAPADPGASGGTRADRGMVLGLFAARAMRYDEAQRALDESLAWFRANEPGSASEATVHQMLGLLQSDRGRSEEAAQCYRRAQDVLDRLTLAERELGSVGVTTGVVAAGRMLASGRMFEMSEDVLARLRRTIGVPCPVNLAAARSRDLAQVGRPAEAAEVLARVLEGHDVVPSSEQARNDIGMWAMLAEHQLAAGDFAGVQRTLARARKLMDGIGLHGTGCGPGSLSSIAEIGCKAMLRAGDPRAAVAWVGDVDRALRRLRLRGPEIDHAVALVAVERVRASAAAGDGRHGWDELQQRLGVPPASDDPVVQWDRREWVRCCGRLAFELGDADAAVTAFTVAVDAGKSIRDGGVDPLVDRLSLARSCHRAGRPEAAWDHAVAATAELQQAVLDELLVASEARRHQHSAVLDDALDVLLEASERRPERLARIAEFTAWRSGLVFRSARAGREALQRAGDEETQRLLDQLVGAQQQLGELLDAPPQGTAPARRQQLSRLRSLREEAERDLLARNREALPSSSLAEIGAALPADTSLVWFAFPPRARRALGFRLTGGTGAVQCLDLGDADDLRRRAVAFNQRAGVLQPRGRDPQTGGAPAGPGLDAALAPLLQPLVGRSQRLLVVADGPFAEVAFAALPLPSARFLVEDFEVVHLPDVVSAGRIATSAPPAVPAKLLLLGGVEYGAATATGSLSQLPGTAQEIERIASRWQTAGRDAAELLTGTAASKAALCERMPRFDALHLASHGRLLHAAAGVPADGATETKLAREISTRSVPGHLVGLACAGANAEPAAWLTAEEVGWLPLARCRLVVLSACDTGVGMLRPGDGALSLRRAFLLAGAQVVISSQRPVDDAATSELMTAFYEHWLRGGPVAGAWRRTQLDALARARAGTASDAPAAWAAFVVAGDWR